VRLKDGTRVTAFKVVANVVDPRLLKMMQQYPTHAVNGSDGREIVDPQTHQKKIVSQPSFLVIVPHANEEIPDRSDAPPPRGGSEAGSDSFVPPLDPGPAPGAGRLPGLR
jgi:hypothetical protein